MTKKSRIRAVIDIGSHSIRLQVGEVLRRGVVRPLEHLWVPVAVGNDTFSRGYVTQGTILDVIKIIKNFQQALAAYGACEVRAVATTGVREAANSETLVERIFITTGIRVKVIDPVMEAQMLFHGLVSLFKDRYGFLSRDVLIFSLGGGSTQLVYQQAGRVVFTDTQNQGTLRLTRDLDLSEDSLQMMLEKVAVDFFREVSHFHGVSRIERLVVVNDDVVHLIRKIRPEGKVKGIYRLRRTEFEELSAAICGMGRTGFRARYGIKDSVSETTRFAFIIISHLFRFSGADQICFPVINTPTAMINLLSEFGDDYEEGLLRSIQDQVLSAARALGEKYRYDRERSERVRRLAVRLFDQLCKEYGFSDVERLYLEVAALLHNIGYFIGTKAHHKHSALLIASSDILGLGRREMRLIGQIARYHRRALPKSSHEEYMGLTERERLIVYRMAALLRLADGLCAASFIEVEDMQIETGEEICRIGVRLAGRRYEYLDVLRLYAQRKSDLFMNFFGMSVFVERLSTQGER